MRYPAWKDSSFRCTPGDYWRITGYPEITPKMEFSLRIGDYRAGTEQDCRLVQSLHNIGCYAWARRKLNDMLAAAADHRSNC
jgi:hypothetical protein